MQTVSNLVASIVAYRNAPVIGAYFSAETKFNSTYKYFWKKAKTYQHDLFE